MENFYSNNNLLYSNPTDMNRRIQLMNTQMESPFGMRGGGFYNPKLLMSSPYESYRCDDAENIDPQILMSLNSGSSSSGDNFSSPSGSTRARYRGGYDRSHLSMVESSGSSSSASAARSPGVFANTPMTMDDDVFVMDEVFVVNALGGRSRSGKDSSLSSTSSAQSHKMDVGKDLSRSSSSSVHSYKMNVGKDSSGSSASSVRSHKMDVCRSWAETGSCRFGSSCQFSHSKEDLSLARLSNKGRPELETCFPKSSFASSPLSTFKGHTSRPAMSRGAVVYGRSPLGLGKVGNFSGCSGDESGSGDSGLNASSKNSHIPVTLFDWMPQDDCIDGRPPGSANPSRNEVLEYINNYLYAPRVKKRLPVFTSICPDSPSDSSPLTDKS